MRAAQRLEREGAGEGRQEGEASRGLQAQHRTLGT